MLKFILPCALFHTISAYYFFPDLPIGVPNPEEYKCSFDNEIFNQNLNNLSLWAYQMLDASGKAPTGVLNGNAYSLGNFEECLDLIAPIQSKYCLVQLTAENIPKLDPPRNPYSLEWNPMESVLRRIHEVSDLAQQRRDIVRIGWCVPASCQTSDLETYLNKYLQTQDSIFLKYNVSFNAAIPEALCQTKESDGFGTAELIFCILTAAILTTVTLATIMDFNIRKNRNEKGNKFIRIFSAINSFHDLGEANYDKALSTFNGMKFMSFIPVFVAHLMCIGITLPLVNLNYIEWLAKSIPIMLVLNGSLFIDGFFVISAFLLVFKLIDDKKNPAIWIVTRYISLTPTFAFVIFFYVAILKHMGQGPLWNAIIGSEVEDCSNNWWTSILYISNYVKANNMCMLQSWYLNCDFHFFIIGIIIIALYKIKPTAAKILTVACFLSSIVFTFAYTYHYEIKEFHSMAVRVVQSMKTSVEFRIVYQTSHMRIPPYLIGMFGGYMYAKMKKNNEKFSDLKSNIIYTISSICLLFPMFSGAIIYNSYFEISPFWNALYSATYRVLWGFGTLGMMMCINFGNAFLMKNVLSWKPFIPLSKLIYGAYLCHMVFILRHFGMLQVPSYYDMTGMWALLFGYLSFAFGVSLVLYICIEAPVKNIYRELTSPKRNDKPKEESHM